MKNINKNEIQKKSILFITVVVILFTFLGFALGTTYRSFVIADLQSHFTKCMEIVTFYDDCVKEISNDNKTVRICAKATNLAE